MGIRLRAVTPAAQVSNPCSTLGPARLIELLQDTEIARIHLCKYMSSKVWSALCT